MSLRLIRRLVVWATCWMALASVFYAPVEVRVRREWQPEGGRDEWLSKGHVRRPLIELLAATLDYQGATEEEIPDPDWLRMAQEVGIELGIGASLFVALRPGKSTLIDDVASASTKFGNSPNIQSFFKVR